MHKIMYILCKLFILKLRLVVRSVLFTLYPPDLRGGRSVLTRRLIIKFTCVVCKHDEIIECEYGYLIHVLILLLLGRPERVGDSAEEDRAAPLRPGVCSGPVHICSISTH
jgi:hypothetical protein